MRWIVILIVVGLAAFYFLGSSSETTTLPLTPTAPPAATATPEATPAPPPPAAPVQAAQPAIDQNLVQRMQQVAQQTGVQLTGFQPQSGGAWIEIAWRSDNRALGGDYLEAIQRQGLIRDFDGDSVKPGMKMLNGARVNTTQVLVRF